VWVTHTRMAAPTRSGAKAIYARQRVGSKRAARVNSPRTIFTVGSSGHSPESLAALLRSAGVEMVLDIRPGPLPPRPAFLEDPLRDSLLALGVVCDPFPALAPPPNLLDLMGAGAPFSSIAPAYGQFLETSGGWIDYVVNVARSSTCALMCTEPDPKECHRGFIAREFERRGWRVEHL